MQIGTGPSDRDPEDGVKLGDLSAKAEVCEKFPDKETLPHQLNTPNDKTDDLQV